MKTIEGVRSFPSYQLQSRRYIERHSSGANLNIEAVAEVAVARGQVYDTKFVQVMMIYRSGHKKY